MIRRSRAVAALLSSAVLCFALGGCDTNVSPSPRNLRLLDLGGSTVVEWPLSAGEPPSELTETEIGSVPAPGRVVRLAMSNGPGLRDNRAALLAPAGTRYLFDLQLPERPVLLTAIGYLQAAEEDGSALRFRVEISAGSSTSEPRVLFDGPSSAALGQWQEIEISLDEWSGQRVGLALVTSASTDKAQLWGGWAAPEIVVESGQEAGWDLILISLDTLRADRLGCYGNARPTSPNLDAFARGAVRFATAVSQSPWTRPSHRSLLTGLYPLTRRGFRSPPLPSVLWQAGYRTQAMTGGGQLDGRFGFAAGFDGFRIDDWVNSVDRVVDWLEANRGRRSFLFLHTYEIHDPYTHGRFAEGLPAGRLRAGFAKETWQGLNWQGGVTEEERIFVEALYDSGIAYTDDKLGLLFEQLAATGVLDRAIVVVTSDHGEQFWEHGTWGHGQSMYEHQLRVPLIVHLPPALRRELAEKEGGPAVGRVVEDQVTLVDLYPTLLDLLGVPLEHRVQGRSLRPLLEGRSLPHREAFAEHTNVPRYERKALRTERYKLVYSYPKSADDAGSPERFELYDLIEDAGEQSDLADRQPELLAELADRLWSILGGTGGPPDGAPVPEEAVPDGIDPDLRKRLEALGYV